MKSIGSFDVVFLRILSKYHVYTQLSIFGHARLKFILLLNDSFETNRAGVKLKAVDTI